MNKMATWDVIDYEGNLGGERIKHLLNTLVVKVINFNICTVVAKRRALDCMNAPLAARSQRESEGGIKQPRAHSLADPLSISTSKRKLLSRNVISKCRLST